MRKRMVVAMLLVSLALPLAAEGLSIAISGGGQLPVTKWHVENFEAVENPDYCFIMGEYAPQADLSVAYHLNGALALGASTTFTWYNSPFTEDPLFSIPIYLDATVTPRLRQVSFPITLSIGGYTTWHGLKLELGPAVRFSAGVDIDLGQHFAFFLIARHEVLITLRDGFKSFDLTYNMMPLGAGIKVRF